MSRIVRFMDQIKSLLELCDRYCETTQKAEATLSTKLFGAGSRITQLRAGSADIGVRRWARALQWLSDNWPVGAQWPEGVERPHRSVDSVPPPFPEAPLGAAP